MAFLALGALRIAFGCRRAVPGRQGVRMNGPAVWALPSPCGRGAHYGFPDLVRLFGELRAAVDEGG